MEDVTSSTRSSETGPTDTRPEVVPTLDWYGVGAVAVAVGFVLFAFSSAYGYHADELYFRMLGERGPALGYVDQPPAVPALVAASIAAFGDSLWGIRVPAVLCALGVTIASASLAAEFGGRRRAQVFAAFGAGTSTLTLGFGHWILTSSVDMLATSVVLLFVVRALLRSDGRWWLPAGVVLGLALYAKYMVLLTPAAVLLGVLLIGPRSVFHDRRLYLGAAATAVIGAPNLVYQLTHDLPQLQMAQALGATDGAANRSMFLFNLSLMLGPILVIIFLVGLVSLFRTPRWRAARAIGIGWLVATAAAYLIDGGRPDYTGGLLIGLYVVGAVTVDRWVGRRRLRNVLVVAGLLLSAVAQSYLSLPVLPREQLADYGISSMSMESIGWPEMVDAVAGVYAGLPPQDRDRAILLVDNFGQAGALSVFGPERGLPDRIYSGHNELHNWGPPPDTATVAVVVGVPQDRLSADFTSCTQAAAVDNGIGVDNAEQGKPVLVCRGPVASWARLWPAYRHLNAYL